MFKSLKTSARERVFGGVLGAILLSTIVALLMLLTWKFRGFAAIGPFIAMGAALGYEKFGKKITMKGIVISIIISFIFMAVAWHIGFVWDICRINSTLYSEGLVDFKLTFWQAAVNPYQYFDRFGFAFGYSLAMLVCLFYYVAIWILIVIIYNEKKKKIDRVAQEQSRLNGEEL